MKDAEEFCTSFALIDFGKLLVTGSMSELLNQGQYTSLEDYFISKTGTSFRD